MSRLISGIGRGVVVISARGRAPEPQPELQHVEGRVGISPLGELVAPGGVELRPAQALGVLRRESVGHRAVRPLQPPPHSGPFRPLVRGALRKIPDGPSIITSRTSCAVSPTSAIAPCGASA